MIRTLIIVSAFAALAGAANATDYHVSLVGKDLTTIRTEVDQAAKLACQEASIMEYAPCVAETYRVAMDKVVKSQSAK
jgi:hypothetical protein